MATLLLTKTRYIVARKQASSNLVEYYVYHVNGIPHYSSSISFAAKYSSQRHAEVKAVELSQKMVIEHFVTSVD